MKRFGKKNLKRVGNMRSVHKPVLLALFLAGFIIVYKPQNNDPKRKVHSAQFYSESLHRVFYGVISHGIYMEHEFKTQSPSSFQVICSH